VDLTPTRAKEQASEIFDVLQKDGLIAEGVDRESQVAKIALDQLQSFWPHTPDLVVVTEEMRAKLGGEHG
jgi:hypothetical protein